MPDRRQHRGAHPEDPRLFAPAAWTALRAAVEELSWLLSRGYNPRSALKLAGDRHALTERQRTAVLRCACADQDLARRRAHEVTLGAARGQRLLIDGFNLLATVEVALSGGVVLRGRDGCYRDMASIHGTYHRVSETLPALALLGQEMAALSAAGADFYLDSPVANSGRLKALILEAAQAGGWDWSVAVVKDPDAVLAVAEGVVVSADSGILDRCARWLALSRQVITSRVPGAWVVDLAG